GELRGGGEAEADAAHGVDVAGLVGVVAEPPAQSGDVHVERLRRPEPVDAPHLVHQLVAREDGARVGHQHVQQVELAPGQVERGAALGGDVGGGVDRDVADLDGGGGGRGGRRRRGAVAGAAQHGPDAGDQLGHAERLHEVVVGAQLEADDAVGLEAAGGEHD